MCVSHVYVCLVAYVSCVYVYIWYIYMSPIYVYVCIVCLLCLGLSRMSHMFIYAAYVCHGHVRLLWLCPPVYVCFVCLTWICLFLMSMSVSYVLWLCICLSLMSLFITKWPMSMTVQCWNVLLIQIFVKIVLRAIIVFMKVCSNLCSRFDVNVYPVYIRKEHRPCSSTRLTIVHCSSQIQTRFLLFMDCLHGKREFFLRTCW